MTIWDFEKNKRIGVHIVNVDNYKREYEKINHRGCCKHDGNYSEGLGNIGKVQKVYKNKKTYV